MKILLLSIYYDGPRNEYENVPMCSLAAFLKKRNFDVKILMKKEHLLDYDVISDYAPDIIGLFVNETNKLDAYNTGEKIRKILPDTYMGLCGLMPTCFGKEMLNEASYFDFAVKGEPEYIWIDIIERFDETKDLREIKGIIYGECSSDSMVKTDDYVRLVNIEKLPPMSRDIIKENNLEIAQISASRGCNANCSFCGTKLYWNKCRERPVHEVVDEIQYLVENFNIHAFNFIEGSLEGAYASEERISDLTREILHRRLNIVYYAHFSSSFLAKADENLVASLKDSGLYSVNVGFDSGNQEDLEIYGKDCDSNDYTRIIRLFNKYQISIEPSFINFNPYSSINKIRENVAFLQSNKYLANISLLLSAFKYIKGTQLGERIASDNLLIRGRLTDYCYLFVNNEVGYLFQYLYKRFISKNSRMYKQVELMPFYTQRVKSFINYYKRQFQNYSDEGIAVINNFESKHAILTNDLEQIIHNWFCCLLDLAERGWCNDTANCLTDKYFSDKFIEDINYKFHRDIDLLNYKLMKLKQKNIHFFPPVTAEVKAENNLK